MDELRRSRESAEEASLPPGVKLLKILRGHTGVICRIAYSPDGRRIASASADHTVRLWDAATGEPVNTLLGHSGILSALWRGLRMERCLLQARNDRTIRLWNANTGEQIEGLAIHDDRVFRVAWSPDGHMLASGSADRTIRLWDSPSLRQLQKHYGHQAGVNDLVWSPHERRLASGSYDQWIRVWDVSSELSWKQMVWQDTGHNSCVNSLAWSRGGLLASASDDATVQIWSARRAEEGCGSKAIRVLSLAWRFPPTTPFLRPRARMARCGLSVPTRG